MLIDTHCHLDILLRMNSDAELSAQEIKDIDFYVKKASEAGVGKIVQVGTTVASSRNSIALATAYKKVWATVGIHPTEACQNWQKKFALIRAMLENYSENKIVGVGETGIDLYHEPYDLLSQKQLFDAHIEAALEHDLPLVIHVRDKSGSYEAMREAFDVLSPYAGRVSGVLHCFQQDLASAERAVEMGLLLGIDGPIGYPRNQHLRDIVRTIGLEHLVLETDAPFLTPQAKRGQPNSPVYLSLIAHDLAMACEESFDEVVAVTTRNAEILFKI